MVNNAGDDNAADAKPEPKIATQTFGGGQGGHSFAALILIAVGALLFLDNLGALPFDHVRAYWPLAISAWGAAMLSRARNGSCMVWHLTMIAAGILLTLRNLGIVHASVGALIWPVVLIAAGVCMLFQKSWHGSWGCRDGMSWQQRRERRWQRRQERWGYGSQQFASSFSSRSNVDSDQLHQSVVFSSVKRRIDNPNFEGAHFDSVFGEIKVDLRGCTISTPDRRAVVDANAAFGAIKLRIPETWKVLVHGNAVFGAFEDKTVPPRPVAGIDPPTLILTGSAAFGAVEIEN